MRGRYPKPAPIDEETRRNLPAPDPPAHLSRAAKKIWRELVESARDYDCLVKLDAPILEQFCVTLELWRVLAQNIEEIGAVSVKRTKKGVVSRISVHKAFVALHKLGGQLAVLAGQIGLSPAARAKLRLVAAETEKTERDARVSEILGD